VEESTSDVKTSLKNIRRNYVPYKICYAVWQCNMLGLILKTTDISWIVLMLQIKASFVKSLILRIRITEVKNSVLELTQCFIKDQQFECKYR
jgi:hypothetical protein